MHAFTASVLPKPAEPSALPLPVICGKGQFAGGLRGSAGRVNNSWRGGRKERILCLPQPARLWNVSKCNFLEVKVEVIKVHLADKVCHNFLGLYDKMTRFLIYKTRMVCWGLWTMLEGYAEVLQALLFHMYFYLQGNLKAMCLNSAQ